MVQPRDIGTQMAPNMYDAASLPFSPDWLSVGAEGDRDWEFPELTTWTQVVMLLSIFQGDSHVHDRTCSPTCPTIPFPMSLPLQKALFARPYSASRADEVLSPNPTGAPEKHESRDQRGHADRCGDGQ